MKSAPRAAQPGLGFGEDGDGLVTVAKEGVDAGKAAEGARDVVSDGRIFSYQGAAQGMRILYEDGSEFHATKVLAQVSRATWGQKSERTDR